jgi:hypothetical protein
MLELDFDLPQKKEKQKKKIDKDPSAVAMAKKKWAKKRSDPNFDRVAYFRQLSERGNRAQRLAKKK